MHKKAGHAKRVPVVHLKFKQPLHKACPDPPLFDIKYDLNRLRSDKYQKLEDFFAVQAWHPEQLAGLRVFNGDKFFISQ